MIKFLMVAFLGRSKNYKLNICKEEICLYCNGTNDGCCPVKTYNQFGYLPSYVKRYSTSLYYELFLK